MNDKIIARIRTVSPMVIGALAAWFLTVGITMPEDVKAALTVALTAILGASYYMAVNWLATRFPKAGWLLGYPAIPVYVPTVSVAETSVMVTAAQHAIALEVAVAESQL
jgi:hypothetical protein